MPEKTKNDIFSNLENAILSNIDFWVNKRSPYSLSDCETISMLLSLRLKVDCIRQEKKAD